MKFWLGASFSDTGEFLRLARASEQFGIDTLTLSDHLFFADFETPYPYGRMRWTRETHWPDPWVTIGAMSAVTTTLRFAPNVYIAPARDLFTVAKQVSTAAALSGGRVLFGVGVGWCREEFEGTGQDFHTRGRRLDEMIPVLRDLWSGREVEHHGRFYDFGPLSMSPPGGDIPIYIGGDSDAALRRAARAGDGWVGNRIYTEEQLDEVLVRLNGFLEEYGRGPIDVIAPLAVIPDAATYRKFADKGVTGTFTAPWWIWRDMDKVDAMERFAEEVIAKL
ncbi:TIGR03619 family F420-dependent LLM class oxidoreductase [Streptosporangiaceae bacterium NEAU-GS5]|nr:TIGR03619 family F420-dependent LLM class oxidoreductase [Streptosporangiaceae bacterium NEAU-GS5]